MQVVSEGVTHRRSEMRPRTDNPCDRKRGKILAIRLKPATHMLRQQFDTIFSRQSLVLAHSGNTFEVVNVVHIIYVPSLSTINGFSNQGPSAEREMGSCSNFARQEEDSPPILSTPSAATSGLESAPEAAASRAKPRGSGGALPSIFTAWRYRPIFWLE